MTQLKKKQCSLDKLPGYEVLQEIYKGKRSLVCRGVRIKDRLPVIIKFALFESPSIRDLNRFQREFRIGQELSHKNVIKYLDLKKHTNSYAIVTEDFSAISLAEAIADKGIDVLPALKIAIQIVQAIGEIHKLDIIHKDVTPKNILVNPKTNEAKITDFGLASHLKEEPSFLSNLNNIPGTLAYISPEQTGRMNRSIDLRTDFYSFGVTLYEMLTSHLPFTKTDPLELVYSHIAKKPLPPSEINPNIPKPVSDIIMKLLEKNAEDRYQSSYGLKLDLEYCINQLETQGTIKNLDVGKNDLSETFQIHQKLYGRKSYIQKLLHSFDDISTGKVKKIFAVISGYSGIGKSSLVQEVYKPLAHKNGYFISGKFDQFRRNVPYASIIEAFQQLVRNILTESDDRVAKSKDNILQAVGQNGQVIIDVIPEVENVIGPQPPVPELGADENRNRFNNVFLNFSRVFAKKEHPLVIFLDDLQWADLSTFHLMESMLSDPDCEYLFFIGAYRDNEVNASHPLTKTIKEIQSSTRTEKITLQPLHLGNMVSLISDSLECEEEKAKSLADITLKRTGGNPFYIKVFLKSLYKKKHIKFDMDTGTWQLDMDKINKMETTENVVDFLMNQLKGLPQRTAKVLSITSIIGNQFDLKLLSAIQKIPLIRVAEIIWPAVQDGFILPLKEDFNWVGHNWESDQTVMFKFSHDRVQQAADSLLSLEEKTKLHFTTGNILLNSTKEEDLFENIFPIVGHLNKANSLIEDKWQLCEFNLLAAKKARLSSAYESALNYITAGFDLLPDNSWEINYDLTYKYYIARGEIQYLNSNWDGAINTFDIALNHSQLLIDRCQIIKHKANLYRMKNDLKAALDTGLLGLAELDIHLKSFPTPSDVKTEIERVQSLIDATGIENLYKIPELKDPLKLATQELLTACFGPAYFLGSRLTSIIGARMSEITIKHGNSPHSAVGYIFYSAISLVADLKDFDNAYTLGNLALKLNAEKYHHKPSEALIMDMWGTFVCHLKEPLDNAKKHLMRGYFSGVENGAYQWAGYCAMINLFMSFWGGDSLQKVSEKIDKILPGLKKIDPNMAEYYFAIKATVQNLYESVDTVTSLSNSVWPNMNKVIETSKIQEDKLSLLVETTCRLTLANLYNESKIAVELAESGEVYVAGTPGVFINPVFRFHQALAFAGGYDSATPDKKTDFLKQIKSTVLSFEHYAEHCPENYLHQALILKSELARVSGKTLEAMDLYDRAIESAQVSGFIQNEGLANELAARFYMALNKKNFYVLYLVKAHYAYKTWGADAKIEQLEQQHPELTQLITSTDGISGQLDLLSIHKSAQALSSEIELNKLIETMMSVVMENVGAQRGLLILPKEDQWFIEAEIDTSTNEIQFPKTSVLDTESLKNAISQIPVAVINYVIRTQKTVVLKDAAREGEFSADPYIFKNKPRSILCKPLINQGQTLGILYMENNLSAKTFTPDRQAALDILTSQIAISLNNAILFDSLNKEVFERKEAEKALQKSVEINRSILTNAMDGVITIDEDGIIQTFNPAAEIKFGYKAKEIIGRNIDILMPEPYKSEHGGYMQTYLKTGKAKILGLLREVPAVRKDGSTFPLEISVSEMSHQDKRMFAGIVRDISIRKKTEDELEEYREHLEDLVKQKTQSMVIAKENAEQANKAKSDFLSRMSHELRTPLNAILGFSQLMNMNLNQELTEEQKSNVGHILKAGNHLLKLVDDVLDLNKIETGRFSINLENLNASLMVEEFIAQIQPSAKERNIKIINLLSQQGNYFIRADHKAFGQIMLNLLNNAVKYNNPGGSITVDGGASDNNIWISVSDTGLGISMEDIGALFEPFNRLGQEQGDIEGTGIGLSITKQLVELMGGSISAECEIGKGCHFKVALPAGIRGLANIIIPDSDISKTDIQFKTHTILYIEDDPQNLNLVESILKHRPLIKFLSATHPVDGIALAKKHRPDLILMDIQLPGMDGITAFKKLQKINETCKIPVIAISAQAMEEDINKALDSGFNDYITKPIDIHEFFVKIDKVLTP